MADVNTFSGTPPVLDSIEAGLTSFCRLLSSAGICVFMVMVFMTFLDVFMRYMFNRPMNGIFEITAMLMPLVVFSSVAYTQCTKSHISMDLLTGKLSEPHRNVLEFSTGVWSLAVCLLSVYASCVYAFNTKLIILTLNLSVKPFVLFVSFGFALMALVILIDVVRKGCLILKQPGTHVIFAVLLAVIPVALGWYFGSHRMFGVSQVYIGICGIIVMLLLFISGMPIGFALMATGFIFSGVIRGLKPILDMYGSSMYSTSANYTWAPLMFFMLMGYFCSYGNLGKDLYSCARNFLGHFRGGLAQGSAVACTTFGAVVGDSISGTIAMTAIALPEMRNNRYDDSISLGVLSCSGPIGTLIPPSSMLILYGVLAEQSIADLFLAGVVPGVLTCVVYCILIWWKVWRHPELAPRLPKAPLAVRMKSLSLALPILALFILVIGGIYGGIFTPTEGAAIGSIGSLIIALCMRRMTWRKFIDAVNESAKYIAMCFFVLTGATVVGYFMTLSKIPMLLANGIAVLQLPEYLTLSLIFLVLLFLGCFIPAIPLMLVCVPILVPVAALYHWDMLWFGIFICIMMNLGCITPPFGINLFVMKGVADVPLARVFRAAVPYIIGMCITVVLIVVFPAIATWLPLSMH